MKKLLDWALSRKSTDTEPMTSIGLLVLRLGVGLSMAFGHGWGKLLGYSERAAQFPDPLGVGSPVSMTLVVFAEFFCALALALGLATRAATIPLIVTMLVAFVFVHFNDPFGKQEKALLYLFPLVTMLLTGPGRYAVDRFFSRR